MMMPSFGSASASVRVEKATSHLLIAPDWAMNLDICDTINTDRWQTKEVVKAVKKRLQHKHPKVQFLALTLLETMMKNCGDYVRYEVVELEVLQEMIKIVKKQNDMQVRDKVLALLDSWQEAFGGPGGKYPQYYWAYIELKRMGMPFPRRQPDAPLTFTAPNAHQQPSLHQPLPYASYATSGLNESRPAHQTVNLSFSDLKNIRSVMELLSEMLRAVNPRDRLSVKDEIIADLVSQCRSNQKKIVELASSTGDEELLSEALTLNDGLQTVLVKHDAIASGSPLPLEMSSSTTTTSTSTGPNIKYTPVAPTPTPVPEEKQINGEVNDDDDDEFAQIARRKSKGKSIPTEQDASSSQSDITVEESSSVASNALVLLDPPPPANTTTKDQDLIDLLSLTITTPTPTTEANQSPNLNPSTPLAPTSSAIVPVPSPTSTNTTSYTNGQGYNPYYSFNQGYNPYYNNYVAPWARPAVTPPQPQYYPNSVYPTNTNPYYQTQTTYQPMQRFNSFGSTNAPTPVASGPSVTQPMQRFNSFGSNGSNSGSAPVATPMERFNSFGSRANNVPSSASQTKEAATGPKPYYMPDSLFGDLIDLKGFGNSNNNKVSSSISGQPMVKGKK